MADDKTLTFPQDAAADTEEPETKAVPEERELSLSITVDDGLRLIPVNNKMGQQIGVFAFRPTDVDMISRFNEMARRWDDEVTKPLEALGDAPDVTVPEVEAALQKVKEKLFTLCDYAFGGNMSEAFFGSMNPFSPVDGGLYCENAMEAVGAFLSKQFDTETAKIHKRVAKYKPTRDHLRKGGKRRS